MMHEREHAFFKKALEAGFMWWHFVVVIAGVFIGYLIGQLPFTAYAGNRAKTTFPDTWQDELATRAGDPSQWVELGVDPLMGLALYLLTFCGAMLGLYIAIKIILDKSFISLITPLTSINWSRIGLGFILWISITSTSETIAYFSQPQDYTWNFQPGAFLFLLVIGFTLLFVQTSFEELFVRGYLIQRFGIWMRYPILAILLTSLFFASLHLMNPEVEKYGRGIMMAYYSLAGIFLAVMTVMDDSLELALGVHYATNLSSALFVSYEGAALQTPALFKMTITDSDVPIMEFILMAGIFLGICWYFLKWRNPKYLITKIQFNYKYVENNYCRRALDS